MLVIKVKQCLNVPDVTLKLAAVSWFSIKFDFFESAIIQMFISEIPKKIILTTLYKKYLLVS
jgi:hypothetical protein